MKKLLILCLAFVFILASCKGGNQDKDKNSGISSNSGMQSDIENSNENTDENTQDSYGELLVDATIEKP